MRSLFPKAPQTWDCYILSALCAAKFQEADEYCSEILKENPNDSTIYLSAGLIQEVVYQNYELALQCYLKSYELKPTASALYNIGLAYTRLNDFSNAEKYLLKALEYSKNSVEINRSLYLLYASQKMFKKAYEHFIISAQPITETLSNLWDGTPSINETLFIFADQGIGDVIMYSRYLPLIKDMFKNIIVSTNPSLISLLRENFPYITFIPYGENVNYDKSTITTLLPYILKMDYNNIPSPNSYLSIKNTKPLAEISTQKLKLGLVWEAGGTKLRGSFDRSLHPNQLEELINIPNSQYYSLQVNTGIDACEKYPQIINLGINFKNFYDTANAISNLDLIITVDTSVAHLAGALGKKTFLILPLNADWRWFDGNTTTWYNSIKIFRQTNIGTWDNVITEIAKEITTLAIE